MEKIYVVGTGGFSSEITQYLIDNNMNILGYFDISDINYKKYGYHAEFLGCEKKFVFDCESKVILAISNNKLRTKIFNRLSKMKVELPTFIHNSCFISPISIIGKGSVFCPFVTITSNTRIGRNFQANIYSYIAHDCVIGNNVTFAPRVSCNGNVVIEDDVYIGTGSIIFQGKNDRPLTIGKGATIAAGSVVTKDVSSGMTVFGNPAIEFTRENLERRK